jgi:bifunctional DNA-binding transcriptional regulator/antitoxin component of YhaV-PrlF toxin-antitoxin module
MRNATVEEDGRIRLPEELRRAAHIEPGQVLDVVVANGVITLFYPPSGETDEECGEEFLKGLDRALDDVREGRITRQDSDEEFLAVLEARSKFD